MPKTAKNKSNSKNKTKKCPIGLKLFMDNYISKHKLTNKPNSEIEKQFIKELLSKFAPNSIKPTDNFYDYINYQWLKNITLEEIADITSTTATKLFNLK